MPAASGACARMDGGRLCILACALWWQPVLIPGIEAIGVLVTTPRFPDHLRANHTNLARYTRAVSLHRVISRSHDSHISLRICHHKEHKPYAIAPEAARV